MATYKGREVEILKELPHPQGDQVVIQHKELSLGQEIVQKKDVIFSDLENKLTEKKAELAKAATDAEHGLHTRLVEVKENTGEFKGKPQ